MEASYPIERESPKKNANFLSRMFFFWMKRICYEGCTKGIELKSLYKIQQPNKSSYLTEHLEKIWDDEVQKGKLKERKPSLLKALFRAYTVTFLFWGTLIFLNNVVVKSVQPLMLSGLIRLFTYGGYTPSDILFYGGGLCLLTLLNAILNHHTNCGINLIGMRVRVAISSLVYRKILRLSQLSLGQTAAGKVVNLLSNDVARFDLIVFALNHLWVGPFQILVVACLMWMQMGPSSMTAIVSVIVLTLPLQLMMGSITSKYRMQVAKKTDTRVKIMSELLAGVQVIKMYSWESPFEAVVEKARNDEVKWLAKTSYVRGVLASFTVFVEKATLCATIVCFVILGQCIKADLVFALNMYISMLNLTMSILFPLVIAMGAECLVSVQRLEEFLLMEEKETLQILPAEDKHVYLKNINSYWVHDTPVLKNLSIKLAPGTLCAVIGPVGSGKSSLLKLLLGEMMTSSGTIEYSGDISYASQEPWLFASTVRNNILFGEEFDRVHYKNVVRVCALERDFELFPDGDKTTVGDRGVSLSGGQRARINLARSVYKDADIYLLDDPLSAVDTKVGRHLFDQCIMEFLRGKTRILVTHQLQYLKKADTIIVLNKGGIEAQGSFEALSQSDSEFTKLLVAADESQEHEKSEKIARPSTVSVSTIASLNAEGVEEGQNSEDMEDEGGYKGSAGWAYIKRFGSFLTIFFIMMLFLLCQVILSGTDYWITYWSNQEVLRDKANNINESYQLTTLEYTNTKVYENITNLPELINGQLISNITRIRSTFFEDIEKQFTENIILDDGEHTLLTKEAMTYIYTFLVIVLIIVALVRSTMFFHSCMQASKKLHNNMFHCLLETPMRFFDTNPAGRILNRFSKDIGAVDELLPRALMDVVQILLIMCGILVMVVIANVYMVVVIVILGGIFFQIRKWYIATARSIKLIEGVAKSPVFSYVNSSINGLTTIRATHNEEILKKQFDDHQDVHTAAWYLQVMCSVSYGLWLDLICALFVCFVIIGFVVLDQFTAVQGSLIGLGISQASTLVGMLQFGMRQISEVVNYLTSVERVLQYTQLEQEHPLLTEKGKKPKEPWPSMGSIVFRNLSLKYVPDNPPVLNSLNIEILPGEKIGIVGRTGAGKSSLIAALFRLAPLEGQISIDDIDTKTIGLRDLRRRISIIPQEPILFSATMRYNLDPFNERKDEELWNALDEVELKEEINSLDFMITEGGNNFSVGQRQLVCLARAILKDNKILILDEATANVDPKTDELIQRTIRRKFQKRTVLTIAHRLNTIMDSDRVLVMDSGCKVEFDPPHILLQNPEGYFTKMLNETGPVMTQTLREVARETYEGNISRLNKINNI